MVPIFGGRRWTVFSTAILIIPCVWLGIAVQNPNTPFGIFIVIALLCGFAGANFASSMGNISFFFPKAKQGSALGINGGLGNLGVSVMQLVAPLVIFVPVFAFLGVNGVPQATVRDVAGECRMDLGAITGDCHDRRLVRDE
ncbi:nitrite extrusion protein 2 [Escherichia coli]|uniref:Nitrite extrusion protein 2 n=1 Tax=Escherichia coli TaxID=562 RepID=A0A376S6T3_ECOLX|nr:nitrite extrusion protein 2 [Escherichia coli]